MAINSEEQEFQELWKEFGTLPTPEEEIEFAALNREFGEGANTLLLREPESTQETSSPDTNPNLQAMPEDPQIQQEELTEPFQSTEAMAMFDQAIAEEEKFLQNQEKSGEIENLMTQLREKLGEDSFMSKQIKQLLQPTNPERFQIESDEGSVLEDGQHVSYLDNVGHLTGGIGHLLTAAEKKKYPEGTKIPQAVVDNWLRQDLKEAEEDALSLLGDGDHPEELEQIITNMAFNLGKTRLRGFKKMFKAIKNKDYNAAADEMVDSKWYEQVGGRSRRLVARMRKLANDS